MKAITFIGTREYQPVTYVYRGTAVESDLFPVALYEFFTPDMLTVFVTPESRDMYWTKLCDRLAGKIAPRPVEIPWGRTSDELWTIFDRVVESVDEGEDVVFDITHSYRSLPFIIFLAMAYLQVTKRIRLRAVTYGAFEARDDQDRAPVFDLSPFLSLLDWLAAVYLFQQSGRAADLGRLLKEIQDRAYRERAGGPSPTIIKNIGQRSRELSQALLLIRPREVMEKAAQLTNLFTDAARQEIEQWAKPFALVAPLLQAEFTPFASTPDARNLDVQRAIIRWYAERGLYAQALTLVREWVVTKTLLMLGYEDPLADFSRKEAERVLNYLGWQQRPRNKRRPWRDEQPDEAIAQLAPEVDTRALGTLWNKISEARNDVDHAGMRLKPASASALVNAVNEILADLDALWPESSGESPRPLSDTGSFNDDARAQDSPAEDSSMTDEQTQQPVTIDLGTFYTDAAKLSDLAEYERRALELAGEGRTVILTGQAPIWLYLRIAHALHGKARRLIYSSPVTGEVTIFDHDPF